MSGCQSDLCQQRVGEHVSSSIFNLLDYLQVPKDSFSESCFLPAYGNVSYWGHDLPNNVHTIDTPDGPTIPLDREQFDLHMLEAVAQRGGQVLPRTRCNTFHQDEEMNWTLDLSHPEHGHFQVNARYLIDATGRSATICKQVGVPSRQIDNLMGLGCFFEMPDDLEISQEQLIEATPEGWWYAARLPNRLITATFFSDADIISQQQLHKQENWLKLLKQSRQLKHKLNGSTLVSQKPWVRNACSQITDITHKQHFLAIGDAATSFDPISSMGIGSAISSACHGARLVHAELMGRLDDERDTFQQDLEANFQNYIAIRAKFYQAETRWPEADFWKRRQEQEAAVTVT